MTGHRCPECGALLKQAQYDAQVCPWCCQPMWDGPLVMTAELREALLQYVGADDLPPVGCTLGADGVWRR
jgi:hypothetical protein